LGREEGGVTDTVRLPVPGEDLNDWGTLLVEYLEVAHNDDGTLKFIDNTGDDITLSPPGDLVFMADGSESLRVTSTNTMTFKNSTAFNLNGGSHPTIPAGTTLFRINEYGHLLLGQNLLISSDNPATFHTSMPDFFWSNAANRLYVRNASFGEINDPPDLAGTRWGGTYPNAGGTNATLQSGSDNGTIIFQVKSVPSNVPFNGNMSTQGASAPNVSATIAFVTQERCRDLTGFSDLADGTALRFSVTRNGREDLDNVFQVSNDGGVRVGYSAIADSATTSPLLFLRGDAGQNQKQTITLGSGITSGTFTLEFLGVPAASPNFNAPGSGVSTAPIAYNATAAAVQTAVEALAGIGAGETTVTGGPLPGTPVVIEFSGTAVRRTNFVRLLPTSTLVGGVASTLITQDGIPDMLNTRMLHIIAGGQTGDTVTADYITIQTPGKASTIFRLESDGSILVTPDGTNNKFVVGQTGIGFFSGTQKAQQTSAGNTHTVAAGSGTAVYTNTTFDGGSGSTAYTIGDLVKAFKAYGLLAS
jgi:hypothetical protein